MHTSYGVVWREGASPLARGKLELLPLGLKLSGTSATGPVTREIAYVDLPVVRIGRAGCDRLNGVASLVLEPTDGDRIAVAAVAQPGIVGELAGRLARLTAA